jgi:hypothetical protein
VLESTNGLLDLEVDAAGDVLVDGAAALLAQNATDPVSRHRRWGAFARLARWLERLEASRSLSRALARAEELVRANRCPDLS